MSAKIIDEFICCIPSHIENMPALNNNGVSRQEMEYKHICFGMAKEIERLRDELEKFQDILGELCCCKTIKEEQGKTDEYLRRQPIAWNRAFEALEGEE